MTELIQKNNIQNVIIKNYGYTDKFIQHGTVEEIENINGLNFNKVKEELWTSN